MPLSIDAMDAWCVELSEMYSYRIGGRKKLKERSVSVGSRLGNEVSGARAGSQSTTKLIDSISGTAKWGA
jgi:hypothetical protein